MGDSAMLSQAARSTQGIATELPVHPAPQTGGAGGQTSALDLLAMLKSGQFSAASFMQLLAALLQSGQMPGGGAGGIPGLDAMMGGQGGQSPIEAAYLGPQQG